MRGLSAAFDLVLDRRLSPAARRPLAVALSGGGDSLALTLLADAWARRHNRELLILTVDHGLQSLSAQWVEACRATAERLGRPFQALAWAGEKPTTGLPAAAREARHRLLADAAREAGAQVILMGHTADDVAEAQAMREAGSTTPDPREWAPSPAWPEGRGVFLLRPLLGVRRTELRDWLGAARERWIEDPANADLRYARSRARAAGGRAAPMRIEPGPLTLAGRVSEAYGALTTPRAALRDASEADAVRLVAMAAVCAGGGARPPSRARSVRLAQALRGAEDLVATLAGARIRGDARSVTFAREAGEAARNGLRALRVAPGAAAVWDGRFEIAATEAVEVRRLAGLAKQLPEAERRRLLEAPADARGGLPAVVSPDGAVSCPMLAEASPVTARSLVIERLAAASGLVERESP